MSCTHWGLCTLGLHLESKSKMHGEKESCTELCCSLPSNNGSADRASLGEGQPCRCMGIAAANGQGARRVQRRGLQGGKDCGQHTI